MRKVLAWLFSALALALALAACVVTLVSLAHSDQWWVQVLNFPRLLTLIAMTLIALGCIAFTRKWRGVLVVVFAASGAL